MGSDSALRVLNPTSIVVLSQEQRLDAAARFEEPPRVWIDARQDRFKSLDRLVPLAGLRKQQRTLRFAIQFAIGVLLGCNLELIQSGYSDT